MVSRMADMRNIHMVLIVLNHKNKHVRASFINLTFLIQLNNKSSVKIMFVLGHYELERFTEDKWDIINMNMLCF